MHLNYRTFVTLAAFVLLVGAFAQAQDKPASPGAPGAQGAGPGAGGAQAGTTASGELTDVDAKGATITVKTATEDMKFRFDDQTKVTGAQKGVAGLATMKGSQVTVQYKKEGANNIATSIDVRPGASSPKDK
jgi:hypothetical protein